MHVGNKKIIKFELCQMGDDMHVLKVTHFYVARAGARPGAEVNGT